MSTAVPASGIRARLGRRVKPSAATLAKRRVQAALATLLALLLVLVAIGFIGAIVLYRSAENRYVDVALPLQTLNRDVLFRLTEEESGVRGYMVTVQRRSLQPYFSGRRALADDLHRIRTLTHGHPELALRTREVARQAQSLRAFYDKLITFVADGSEGRDQAKLDVLDAELRAAQFRTTLGLMQNDVDSFIAQTRSEQHRTYLATLATLGTAGALGIFIAAMLLTRVPERLRRAYVEQEQGAQASQALEHVSEAVFLVDDDELVCYWNRAAELLYGASAAEALGQPVRSVVADYDELVEAAEHGDRFVPVVLQGTERWIAPVVDTFEGGSVLAVRDASGAYALERARTDFVATASHELRTPLTAVYGGASTLVARGDALSLAQRQSLLKMIVEESEQLTRIVDQLLVSAQLDRGTLRIDEAECNVAEICSAVVHAANVRAAPSDVNVALQLPAVTRPLRTDASLIRQLLVNLVENAVKYSVEGGLVVVRLVDAEEEVRIDVVDRGLGIPSTEHERIFEKFYRLDAEMTRGVGGSGLGLYISREIVEQLGGTLTVRSQVGHGSTFSVTLPRRQ
jgi:two-component system, OmpR family, phosphate regulon sensor histidine kinase PhoR